VKTLQRFAWNAKNLGLRVAIYKVYFVLRGFFFDIRRGIRTTSTSTIVQHGYAPGYGTGNFPCNPRMLRKALVAAGVQEGEVFLDIGCGRGRALVVAAEFPFSRIIGIDVVNQNVIAARANLQRCCINHAEVRLSDAQKDALDEGDVWYFFRPFSPDKFVSLLSGVTQPPRVIILGNADVGSIEGYERKQLQQHRVYPNFRFEVLERS
jgi:SAM-dependent methyltransferase